MIFHVVSRMERVYIHYNYIDLIRRPTGFRPDPKLALPVEFPSLDDAARVGWRCIIYDAVDDVSLKPTTTVFVLVLAFCLL